MKNDVKLENLKYKTPSQKHCQHGKLSYSATDLLRFQRDELKSCVLLPSCGENLSQLFHRFA